MKLVKIENIREGQIYKDKNNLYLIIDIICGNITYQKYNTYDLKGILKEKRTDCDFLFFRDKERELIGFLGITHEIKDNKLVEITREELGNTGCYIDDIFINEYEEVEGVVLGMSRDGYIRLLEQDGKDIYETGTITEKIGILGVNYEFINDKLVKEND